MTAKPPRHLATLIVLLVLTAITAGISEVHANWPATLLLVIALVKVLLVVFRFMNLRHSHLFWKSAVVLVSVSLLGTLCLLAVP